MNILVIAGLGVGLVLLGNWPAAAADLPVKAPQGFPYASEGWYVGIGTLAATTNAEVNVPALGSGTITTVGAGIGPVVGYHSGSAASFRAIEGAVYWQNLGGSDLVNGSRGAVAGSDIKSELSTSGRVKIGGVGIMQTLGSILPVGLFGGGAPLVQPVTGQPNMPYFSVGFDVNAVKASLVGVEAKGWQVTPTFGMGYMSQIMNPTTGRPTGYVTDISIEYTPAGRGFVIGGDDAVDANLGRKFLARAAILR